VTTPTEPGQPGDPNAGYGAPGYGTPAGGTPAGDYGAMPPAPESYGAGPVPGGMPELANWGQRFGGWVLEYLLPSIVIGLIFQVMLDSQVLSNIVSLIYVLGFLAWQEGTTGQSWGKKIVGIRLLREQDGQVMGWPMAAVRKIVHIVDALPCLLGYFWPLWDKKRQTFADKILKTVVVKV
jgi:uncharacterized RDD family membrane protein YckC